MAQAVPLRVAPVGWTSRPDPPPNFCGRWTYNLNNAKGYLERDKGFKRFRHVKVMTSKPAASWVYRAPDGGERIIYYADTELFEEDGSDLSAAIKSSLTSVWLPMFACIGTPFGGGVFVNGTDAPQLIRENSGGSALEVKPANLEKPNTNWTATGSTSGGSLADDTYYVRIAQIEIHATTGTITSRPSEVKTVTISGGGGAGKITVAQATWTANSRATNWIIGVSSTTDTPTAFLTKAGSYDSLAIATTSYDVLTTGDTAAFANRNGIYQTADMADLHSGHPKGIIVHEGRFFVWYEGDNDIYWSERGIWGWYTTNSVDNGAEGGWNLPVKALWSWRGSLLVFTPQSIHGVFGNFARDDEGLSPSYEAFAEPRVLVTNAGIMGGPYAVTEAGGDLYFMSTLGPAIFNGRVVPLAPEDMDLERACWDTTGNYPNRWCVAEDPDLRMVCFSVTRKTNSSRPMDGASVAGIPDYIYRWSPRLQVWCPPRWLDAAHLSCRATGSAGAQSEKPRLMVMGPHGQALQMNFGHAGGDADGVVTSTNYDGILASSNTTTTAVIAMSGISADDFRGHTVTLTYPSNDSTYKNVKVQKTIRTNTATSGGNITLTWEGAVTVPSTSTWTVRVSGYADNLDWGADMRDVLQMRPDEVAMLESAEVRFRDAVGTEATS